ncbi:MAG: SDR family NAD(P)-dependent oxidoreductase [Alphaproteobacteria bacterium]
MSSGAAADFGGKHVVITGGASGFGWGCALRFAALGACVTVADITQDKGEEAARNINTATGRVDACRFEELDLSRAASIDAFARRMETGASIDILLNNAGIYPPSQYTVGENGQELTFAIAYLGHFQLTAALWPGLLAAGGARVISVTSIAHKKAQLVLGDGAGKERYVPIRAYQQAKLACLMFALELDQRCQAAGAPVRSVAIHPGIVKSNLGANRLARADDNLWQRLMRWVQGNGMQHFGQSPAIAADAAIMAAGAPIEGRPFYGPIGPFEAFGRVGRATPGGAALDLASRQALWRYTEDVLDMEFKV